MITLSQTRILLTAITLPLAIPSARAQWVVSGTETLSNPAKTLPPSVSNPTMWVDASNIASLTLSGNHISAWNDLSGNANPLTRADLASQPTIGISPATGHAAVAFDGSDVLANNFNIGNPYTIFTASSLAGSLNARLLTSTSNNWLLGYWGGGENRMFASGWVLGSGGPAATTSPHFYGATGSGTRTTFYNGTTILASNANGTAAPNGISLGAWENNPTSDPSRGYVSELIIFNRVLSATEINDLNTYLQAKWSGQGQVADNTSVVVNAGNTLALDNTAETVGSLTGGGAVTLTNAVLGLGSGGASATFSGSISGNGGIAKLGAGTQTLSGTNIYSGGTQVLQGTLDLGNNGNVGSPASLVNIGSHLGAGTLAIGGGSLQASSITLGTDGPGTLNLSGGTVSAGTLNIGGLNTTHNAGTLILTGGSFSATSFDTLSVGSNSVAHIIIGGTADVTLPAFPTARGAGASATITFDGGTLSPAAPSANFISNMTAAFLTANGANLNVAGGNDITIPQVLVNATAQNGTLTKTGAGTLTLSGANTYSGGTSLTAGGIRVGNGLALGTGAITLGGGTLATNGTHLLSNALVAQASTTSNLLDNITGGDLILAGPLGGDGTLEINSTLSRSIWFQGDLSAFTGIITYTNNNNGTNLRLGGGPGTTPNSETNGSDLSGASLVLSGATGNNRGVSWNGLSGATVEIGALSGVGRIGLPGSRAANWKIGALGLDTVYNGTIEGAGSSLTKTGTGTLTLGGTSMFAGNTTVEAGVLLVNGNLGNSAVTVQNNAMLGGSGTLGGNVTVLNGGILSPGNSTGIITIGGNLSLNTGAITRMEINGAVPGTGHDRIVVGGISSLAGTLELFFGGGVSNGDTFTLIDTANPIIGNFDSVVNVLGNALSFSSTIADDYILKITAVQSDFATFARTRNQQSVANAIDDHSPSGQISDLVNYLNTLPGASLPPAFDEIAPVQFAFLPDVVFAKNRFRQRGLAGQMRERRSGASGISTSQLQVSSPAGSIDWINSTLMAPGHGRNFVGAPAATAAPLLPSADNRWGFFASGTFEHISDDRNGPGNDSTGGGLTLGADYQLNDCIVIGFYAGYEHSDLDFGSNGGDVRGNAAAYGLYGTWFDQAGNWLETALGGGYHRFTTTRDVFGADADGKTNATDFWANITCGHDFHLGSRSEWTLTPSAGLSYNRLETDAFTETGSLAPLALQSQTSESLRSEIGLRLDYRREWSDVSWIPYLHCGWQHEFLDTSESISARFATGGGIFTVTGSSGSRNTAIFGTGLNAIFSDNLSAGIGYNGEVNSDFQIHQAFASFRMRF
jgi:fibronectin-binding autotransporter adhesin